MSDVNNQKFIRPLVIAFIDAFFFNLLLHFKIELTISLFGSYLVTKIFVGIFSVISYQDKATDWFDIITTTFVSTFTRGGIYSLLNFYFGVPLAVLTYFIPVISQALEYFLVKTLKHYEGIEKKALLLIVLSVALRFSYFDGPNLLQEEAYYWNYAQHFSLGYLDHPPLVAWLISLGTFIFGSAEIGVRFFALFSWLLAAYFSYQLAKNLYGKKSALISLIFLSTLPIYFGFGFFITPDSFLFTSWAGMLFALERALLAKEKKYWYLVGIFLGLGLLSKYTIALVGLASLIFITFDRETRNYYFKKEPYLAVILAFILFSPVIYWNATHDWASFAFQTTRRLNEKPEFSLFKLFKYMNAQVTPFGLIFAAYFLASFKKIEKRKYLFQLVFTFVPISVFVFFSLRHNVRMSWTAPAWLALFPFMGYLLVAKKGEKEGEISQVMSITAKAIMPSLAFLLIACSAILSYLTIGLPFVHYRQKSPKFISYKQLGIDLESKEDELTQRVHEKPLIVCMDTYSTAALVSFYRNYKHSENERIENIPTTTSQNFAGYNGLMFSEWLKETTNDFNYIIVVSLVKNRLNPDYLHNLKNYRFEPMVTRPLEKLGRPASQYYYRVGKKI